MSAQSYDGYPVYPQGQEAGRFMDPTVTPEASFNHVTKVEYDGGTTDALPETSLVFEEPGDGFEIGLGSSHKYANGMTEYIVRTDKARYHGDSNVFARYEPFGDGSGKGEIKAYEASTLGDGISGRIGEPITLPGSKQPEVVKNIELRYKHGPTGDRVEHKASPFYGGRELMKFAHGMVEARNRNLGRIAQS